MAAAEAMRRILIDRARRKKAIRHGGEWQRTELDSINAPAAAPDKSSELLALDEALRELSRKDERKGRLVKLRYFVGFTTDECSNAMGISTRKAHDIWSYARSWLRREIGKS